MSLSLSAARARITKVKPDKTSDSDGGKSLSVALNIEVKVLADFLAEFHPALRHALFIPAAGVRFKSMKEVGWEGTRRGIDLAIRPGPDLKPAVRLQDVTLRDFKLKPVEEAGQQLVAIRMTADVENPGSRVSTILEYLKEESWIDLGGGGELDLAPPSAREKIEGLEDPSAPPAVQPPAAPPAAPIVNEIAVIAVRKLQPSKKGVQARLTNYPDEVLRAAIAAEGAAADSRPMFISMLEGELKRRHDTH